MTREEEMIKERMKKIDEIRKLKINPYPYSFDKKNSAAELQEKYAKLKPEEKKNDSVKIAGRAMMIRLLGKINFASIQDGTGKIQVIVEEGNAGKKLVEFFSKYVDAGDFIGVEGTILRTKRGELSVNADEITILSKAILPMPEKWHGLQDIEERYRQRYVDLFENPDTKKVFETRTKIINAIREFLDSKGFIEVETPLLQPVYGGANARPFITHLHDLDLNMYLSISPELYLKRLIVGGFEKVYTICKNFRNESIDRSHNPEFTMLECYQSYADYNDMIKLFEEIYEHVMKKIGTGNEIVYQDKKLNFKRPWQKVTMYDGLKKHGVDVKKMTDSQLMKKAKELKLEVDAKMPRGILIAELAKALVEPELIQPTHFMDHTKETTPLCKINRKDGELIERNEPFMAAMEMGNMYSELNDPVIQKELFKEQEKVAKKEESHPNDKDFVNALEQGMPPCGGLGLGVDRMVMILTNSASIRDVILFPFMRKTEEKK
jgi:lysyl-tRNA synthetase class 2